MAWALILYISYSRFDDCKMFDMCLFYTVLLCLNTYSFDTLSWKCAFILQIVLIEKKIIKRVAAASCTQKKHAKNYVTINLYDLVVQ